MKLSDQVAIVSGGSRGIGREIVKTLSREGATVFFTYIASNTAANELERGLQKEGHPVYGVRADIVEVDDTSRLMDNICKQSDRVNILVNNAGITRDALLLQMSDQDFSDVLNVNLKGMVTLTRCVLPLMMRQRRGKIVNLSSVAASHPRPGHTNYSASKGAVNSFTKALAVEVASRNINVNAVAPGVIETEMSRPIRERYGAELTKRIPLRRFGTPEDVARCVLFLASSDSDYITGQIITVSGGTDL